MQSYRTKKEHDLQKKVIHTCDEVDVYTVVVKVIDILTHRRKSNMMKERTPTTDAVEILYRRYFGCAVGIRTETEFL